MKRKFKKRPLFFLLGLILVITVGTTLAFFNNQYNLPEKFKTMTFNVDLVEEFYNDFGVDKVTIVNNEVTNAPVVIRINYNEIWQDKSSNNIYLLSNQINGEDVVTKEFTNAFLNDFIYIDGWYYYKKILNATESVQILNSIALNDTLISSSPYYEDYNNFDYRLVFSYEAIQADIKAVKNIWNKDITINGTNVTWQ